jgi:hypothetical protein
MNRIAELEKLMCLQHCFPDLKKQEFDGKLTTNANNYFMRLKLMSLFMTSNCKYWTFWYTVLQ